MVVVVVGCEEVHVGRCMWNPSYVGRCEWGGANVPKSRISVYICLYLVISVYICLNEYTSLALPPDTNLYEYKFIRIPICTNVL